MDPIKYECRKREKRLKYLSRGVPLPVPIF